MIRKHALNIFCALIIAFMLSACPEETEDKPFKLGEAKVAAYISTWSTWNAGLIKGEYISDLIISFALISKSDGYSLYIPELSGKFFHLWDEISTLKKKYPHLNVNLSVGGANEAGFSPMAENPAKRAGFIADVCDWLEKNNLDGVDIDWEYPVRPLTGGGPFPQDRENYILLLEETRVALDALGEKTGKRYSLSTAVPANSRFTTDVDAKKASEIVDSFKLMSYDYYGSWSSTTGHNAKLFRNPRDPNNWSTDHAVSNFINAGVRPEKIMLGTAFYGRIWGGVAQGSYSATPGLFQSYQNVPFGGSLSWTTLKQSYLTSKSGYTRYWDDVAKAPYLYNGNRWITYTDEEQIAAVGAYAKEKKLGGVFTWEYANDMSGELIKALAESAK